MFFKNLKYFLRSLRKDRTFAIINLFGMSAGILVALFAGSYAFYQLSFDKFVKDHDRIYRLEYVTDYMGNIYHSANCSLSLAKILQTKVPGISEIIAVHKPSLTLQLDCEGKTINLEDFMMVSPNFIKLYQAEFIYGSSESALTNSKSLILTESLSQKYFPNENSIGKHLVIEAANATRFIVSAVIKDLPPNTHYKASAIALGFGYWPDSEPEDDYDPENLAIAYKYVFLVLDKNTSIDQILPLFTDIKNTYMRSYLDENGFDLKLIATPLTKVHFKQNLMGDQLTENINSIYYFLLIAFIVILISIINFINLSLARQAGKNIDIGIRKTFGATKYQVFRQYLVESYLFILISFMLSSIAFYFLLTTFTNFTGLELNGARFSLSGLYLLIPIMLVVGFLAGFYPALVTARKNPQFILQNKSASRSKEGNRIFIIIQLVLAILFFIGTIAIFLQLKYSQDVEKGYDLENVIAYEYYNFGSDAPQTEDICEMLLRSSYIIDVAVSTKLPGQNLESGLINIVLPDETVKVETEIINIDQNYLPFTGINLLYGRNFNEDLASDSAKVIINATFAKTFGSLERAIGARAFFPKANENEEKLDAEIIGVVCDFHFQSMHHTITPLLFVARKSAPNFYHIKFHPQNLKFVLEDAQKVFDNLRDQNVFAATKHFPEEELLKQYETDKHLSQITIWLAILSIILAILGVFGLTAFLVRNNLKMLCIRKVFGAEIKDLFKLLLKNYTVILLISNFIALPLSWYVCTKWLERFAYHISLSIWLFAAGIVMSVSIVIIAILYHIWIISKTDPVVYLQDE